MRTLGTPTKISEKNDDVTHAQCWIHSRRKFIETQAYKLVAAGTALDTIAQIYPVEKEIRETPISGEKKRQHRLTHSKPIVGGVFEWCDQQLRRGDLTPSNPLHKALGYVTKRATSLRVFLEDPDVAPDTNHLERGLRPIPMGRKA